MSNNVKASSISSVFTNFIEKSAAVLVLLSKEMALTAQDSIDIDERFKDLVDAVALLPLEKKVFDSLSSVLQHYQAEWRDARHVAYAELRRRTLQIATVMRLAYGIDKGVEPPEKPGTKVTLPPIYLESRQPISESLDGWLSLFLAD